MPPDDTLLQSVYCAVKAEARVQVKGRHLRRAVLIVEVIPRHFVHIRRRNKEIMFCFGAPYIYRQEHLHCKDRYCFRLGVCWNYLHDMMSVVWQAPLTFY